MSCGIKLEARRNADFRVTFTPASRNFTFSGMAPLFSVRLGEGVLLQIGPSATPNGSNFVVVGDSVVLTIEQADLALLDSAAPDTSSEALFYDVTLTDQTGFENWIVGGPFILLGINDISCGGCSESVEVSLGGACVQISIEGGNTGAGASVALQQLNQAVADAEQAASDAAESAAEAGTAGAEAGAIAGASAGAMAGAGAGTASGAIAGEEAANAVVAGKADTDGANITPSNATPFRKALITPRVVDPIQAATAQLAATYAYVSGFPFLYGGDADLSITLDVSAATTNAERFAILKGACDWQSTCVLTGYGRIKIVLPDGATDYGAQAIIRRAGQPPLWLAASALPTAINITGLSITNVSGKLYEVTVTVASALPARVVPGYAIGHVFVAGNNDARAFSGAGQVRTIAPDRLSYTYRARFETAPVAPTTFDYTVQFGRTQSQASIPFACSLWSGGTAAVEAFINLSEGAVAYSHGCGWSWNGTDATTDGAVLGMARPGSFWYCVDQDVFVGGPTKTVRAANGGSFYANRCCFGGNDYAPSFTSVTTQDGGEINLIRCSMGGARTGCVSIGQGTRGTLNSNMIVGGQFYAVELLGSDVRMYPNVFGYGPVTGALSMDQGASAIVASGGNVLTIQNSVLGLAWKNGSRIVGVPTFASNTTDAQDTGNVLSANGVWITDTAAALSMNLLNLTAGNLSVVDAVPRLLLVDGATTAIVNGDAGNLRLSAHSSSRDIFFGHATTTQATWKTSNSTFLIGANQVLKAREAAVTKPTGGATIDAECRTALNALIDRLGTLGHGLIANT